MKLFRLLRRAFSLLTVGVLLISPAAKAAEFHTWAATPVMGWNSWDFYGTSINEERSKAQADYMAANLLPYGWNLITVDIQWYEPTAEGFNYKAGAALTMDEWSRLTPALNRFPTAAGGVGFKALADYVHAKGLKFGIHMMRGIPRQAYDQSTPIKGSTYTARDIADPTSTCSWNGDMYGVDMTKPGAQAYYDSIMELVASWDVDFVKIDDLSRPYHQLEIEGIRKAIDKTGRAIVFSTSPGETPVAQGSHVMEHANQWRISDDFWDNWGSLYEQFKRLHDWTPYRGPGHFPDADMIPLGMLAGGSNTDPGRPTFFTPSEQYTLMSLWAIARSPLIFGGDMLQMDPLTLSLLTNTEVIAVNQHSLHNRQLFNRNNMIAWVADVEGSTDKYLAVFNTTGASANVPVVLSTLGFTGSCTVRSLWDKTDLGSISGTFSPTIAAHGGALYRLTGDVLPTPWLTEVTTAGAVDLAWEPISAASSYSVKRSTSEGGTYQTLASGLTAPFYSDVSAQDGTTYYYVVSAIVDGQETPNSGVRSGSPVRVPGIVSWNLDRYGSVPSNSRAGVESTLNWSNSFPSNPTVNLPSNLGVSTTVDIAYSSYSVASIQDSHPDFDADGSSNKEMLNGYLNSGRNRTPATSSISISQIPYKYYDLYVYFSSSVAGRPGTVTDGTTTFRFSTIGAPSIAGENATLTQTTTTTGSASPAANYAIFRGQTSSSKTVTCNIPLLGGLAAFQIVPRTDPILSTPVAVQSSGDGTTLNLSWPSGLGTMTLQQSGDLKTWTPTSPQPTSNSITVPVTGEKQFFRLARP